MKYTLEIEIGLPMDRVIELFDNPDNLKHWQPGMVSFEHQSGEPGQPGAVSILKYKMGKREVELKETVLVRNLPEEFSGTYEANGVTTYVNNSFKALAPDRTLYTSHNEVEASGFFRIMLFFMPGMFRKQSSRYMENFRDFAERQG